MLGKKRTGDESVFFNIVKQLCSLEECTTRGDAKQSYITLFIDERPQEEIVRLQGKLGIEKQQNVSIVMLPTSNAFLWNMWVLPQYLKKHPVDIYHTQYIVPLNLPRSIKVVTHIHDVSFCEYPQYISIKDRIFLRLLIPRSLRRADMIIAVSEFTKAEIIRFYKTPAEKIEVVYNGLADEFVSTQEISKERLEEVRLKYNLPPTFVLYVGTLQPRKNIPSLIRAFALMQSEAKNEHVSLVIVGQRNGYHYDTTIDTTIEECAVSSLAYFPGYIDQQDLPILMRLASVFVFPSLYEGFGIPILEAMSQSVPVIASDIPVHREIAGDGAEYVDTHDLVKFSEVLYTMIIDDAKRAQLVSAGTNTIHQYTWHASAQRMLSIYTSLHPETIFRNEK